MKKLYYLFLSILILLLVFSSIKLIESINNLTPLEVTISDLETKEFFWKKFVKITGTSNYELTVGALINPVSTEMRNIFILTDKTSKNALIIKFEPNNEEKERLEKGKEIAKEYFKEALVLQKKISEYNLKIKEQNEKMKEPQKRILEYQNEFKQYQSKVEEFNKMVKEHNEKLLTLQRKMQDYYFRLNLFIRNSSQMTKDKFKLEEEKFKKQKKEIEDLAQNLEKSKQNLSSFKAEVARKEKSLAAKKPQIDNYLKIIENIKIKLLEDRKELDKYQKELSSKENELKKLLTLENQVIQGTIIEPPENIVKYLNSKGLKVITNVAIYKDKKAFPLLLSLLLTFISLGGIVYLVYKLKNTKSFG